MDKLQIRYFRKYINSFELWQRLGLVMFVLLVIFLLWLSLLYYPLTSSSNDLLMSIKMQQKSLIMLRKQFIRDSGISTKNGKKVAANKDQQEIIPIQSGEKLTKVLTNLLHDQSGLELISLSNQPQLVPNIESKQKGKIYRHDITLQFSGEYFTAMHYLRSLEKLRLHLYWDKLEYTVVEYPIAKITLQLHFFQNRN